MIKSLLITLRGPCRSWGGLSVGDDRGTLVSPTASAILGIAGACMGIDHRDAEKNKAWYKGFSVCTVSAVDFHDGDYNTSFQLETDFQTAQKTRAMNDVIRNDTVMSKRNYLSDAIDVAAIIPRHKEAEIWLANLVYAFFQPTFTPYLGRRAFPFSAPLLEQDEGVVGFDSVIEVAEALFTRLSKQRLGNLFPASCLLRLPVEIMNGSEFDSANNWEKCGKELVPDQRSGALRTYEHRMVCEYLRIIGNKEVTV